MRRVGEEERGGNREASSTYKLKNLHSYLALTSLGTTACAAAVPSSPAHSTLPAPPAIGRATERERERERSK